MKVLFVCLGNICRSPLAEGILRHQLRAAGLEGEVDSAGTGGHHAGESPDPRSVAVALEHGIDISGQRARKLQAADLEYFDRIYAMDSQNYQDILRLARTDAQRAKVDLLLNLVEPNRNPSVPDPYYGGRAGFERVFALVERACAVLCAQWPKKI